MHLNGLYRAAVHGGGRLKVNQHVVRRRQPVDVDGFAGFVQRVAGPATRLGAPDAVDGLRIGHGAACRTDFEPDAEGVSGRFVYAKQAVGANLRLQGVDKPLVQVVGQDFRVGDVDKWRAEWVSKLAGTGHDAQSGRKFYAGIQVVGIAQFGVVHFKFKIIGRVAQPERRFLDDVQLQFRIQQADVEHKGVDAANIGVVQAVHNTAAESVQQQQGVVFTIEV